MSCRPRLCVALQQGSGGVYMDQVARVTDENLAAGYIVWQDAAATKAQAAASAIGKRQ